MDLNANRDEVYGWLRRCLIGPPPSRDATTGTPALRGVSPLERFQTAILFPVVEGEYGSDAADGEDDEPNDTTDPLGDAGPEATASGLSRPKRRFVPPSSVGLSFFISGDTVRFQLIPRAVRYEPTGRRDARGRFIEPLWQRESLDRESADAHDLRAPAGRRVATWRASVFDGRGELFVLWRPIRQGWLVTASLSNAQTLPEFEDPQQRPEENNRRALFEVELRCSVDTGEVGPYPGVDYSALSTEEQELELQYRHHRIYGIGHGAAVDWELKNGHVVALRTEFLPRVEVPRVSADVGAAEADVLRMDWLAGIEATGGEVNATTHCAVLDHFVAAYRAWVEESATAASSLADTEESATAQRILERMRTAVKRMRAGIELLARDPVSARAFALANRAMAKQMRQADRAHGKPPREPRWRPFQLAFLLLALESTVDEDSPDRELVDLIWFPTGGGKTEAYLGLMAFVICRRRLKFPTSGGGTAILMRYTLRLLTKDQFRRAARLICALELLRRTLPDLGQEPVTLGLWVGAASSPNTFQAAKETLDQARDAGETQPPSLLVLEACPWCGAAFRAPDNFDAGSEHFRFRCIRPDCDFGAATGPEGSGVLPCNVVDAALYAAPSTLLLATIDKFARLAWEERTTAFFGQAGNRPPELIVQDELHLIAGALGSVAGLYEAGLETVLSLRGVYPKYIASTATIRMATEQVQRLYGRGAAVFPPPGLDCDDAYFARTVPLREQPGRLYVGYLAPARNRQRCLAPLAASLLAAPERLFDSATADRAPLFDAWWTLLVYHGSLKGVGTSRNALQDIEQFMARYQGEALEQARAGGLEPTPGGERADSAWTRRERLAERIAQLTSHMSADENARTFERLRLAYDRADGLDLVLATNMVSVGLDVARLALMVVNGQPLTTAEYIQASSRVGRAEVPGIVVANYYRDQARSLSHYESFRAYHESFYRFVEPTSVTPYTYQARLRALHAALVIAVRHSIGTVTANENAGDFDPREPAVAKLIEALTLRCGRADPGRAEATAEQLRDLAAQWGAAAEAAGEQRQRLVYSGRDSDRRDQRLLYGHEAKVKGLWPTLNNMRNVENTALVRVP